jgi:Ran GTPase-activating protein (RanGAP) involved in mRNA processing and transport
MLDDAHLRGVMGSESLIYREMLLARFLSTKELVRLSTCAAWTLPYRYQLSRIHLHDPGTPTLETLLPKQLCLEWLTLRSGGALPAVLKCLGPAADKLQRLDLSWSGVNDAGAQALATAMRAGSLWALQELLVGANKLTPTGWAAVFGALRDRCCPGLQRLSVNMNVLEERSWGALMEAVGDGALSSLRMLHLGWSSHSSKSLAPLLRAVTACTALEVLDLSGNLVDEGDMPAVAGALEECIPAWRALRELHLERMDLDASVGAALARAWGKGAGKCLERLNVSKNEGLRDEGVRAMAEVWASGACPSLRWLGLMRVAMGPVGCRALADALAQGALPGLNELYIYDGYYGDEGAAALAEALEAGGGRALSKLNVKRSRLTVQGMDRLREAAKACPRLTGNGLWLRDNPNW